MICFLLFSASSCMWIVAPVEMVPDVICAPPLVKTSTFFDGRMRQVTFMLVVACPVFPRILKVLERRPSITTIGICSRCSCRALLYRGKVVCKCIRALGCVNKPHPSPIQFKRMGTSMVAVRPWERSRRVSCALEDAVVCCQRLSSSLYEYL